MWSNDEFIDHPLPEIQIKGKLFCLTGEFIIVTDTVMERMIGAAGGMTKGGLTRKTDYLVIGSEPSPAWSKGKCGTKIVKASEWKQKGLDIKIISEQYLYGFLQDYKPVDEATPERSDLAVLLHKYLTSLLVALDITEDNLRSFYMIHRNKSLPEFDLLEHGELYKICDELLSLRSDDGTLSNFIKRIRR